MIPKYLFVDTETSGLPRSFSGSFDDINNWPRIVEIGWLLADAHLTRGELSSYIIKPEGFSIPTSATEIHGISHHQATNSGYSLRAILEALSFDLSRVSTIVCHNKDFDLPIIHCELLRCGMYSPLDFLKTRCTMKESTVYCGIKNSKGRLKWPKLQELHYKLFGTQFSNAHTAGSDILATYECFRRLTSLGIIPL